MSHTVEVSGNAVVATVPGALDGEAARGLSAALREKSFPGAVVILELSGVTSVDVEGITQLVTLKRRAEREQGRLVLAAPSYEVMDALRSNGLDRDFETAPTLDAAQAAAGVAAPHAAAPPAMHGEPEAFHAPPPPVRHVEEPVRRREADDEEQSEWVKPAAGTPKAERAAPPPVAAAPPVVPGASPKPKKAGKSALPLILVLLLLLGGGGAAAWFFLKKKPEVLTQEGEWTRVEGTDTEFEVKFKNAFALVLKSENLPEGLYLDTTTKDYTGGLLSQTIKGDTHITGDHTFTVTAKPAGDGAESPPVTFKFKITAEEVRDTSGGKLRELTVKVPLPAGVQPLANGCVKATAEGLEGTGLSVKTEATKRVAHLEGTPTKDGEIKFTLKAENADAQVKTFTYSVKVKPEPAPVVVVTDPPKDPIVDPKVADPKTPDPKVPDPKTTIKVTPPPPPPPPILSLEPAMLTMLSERVEKSRFPETEKMQMRAAVNQVEGAKRLATIHFQHGERSISDGEKAALEQKLGAAKELARKEDRERMDFVVIGYASRRGGTLAQNVAISKARAASVESVLKSGPMAIQPKFTGDYGATDVLGPNEDENRVVEIYAVVVKEETRDTLKRLIEDMKRISGSH